MDPTPLAIGTVTYALPAAPGDRLYPVLSQSTPYPGQFLKVSKTLQAEAGFWDDVYKTEDSSHTFLGTSWSRGAASITLSNQFLRIAEWVDNKTLGVNFTSQSTTCMGHSQVATNAVTNESNYYFADVLRGGPAYYSFRDHRPERTVDSYQALPIFGFHSFGRSGSEINGLFKMLVAGGYLPRTTKDSVKRNGLYPATLLYLYKASLPYANADGTEVGYTNELRHRVGYLSTGDATNSEFMPYNQWYHRYDEGQHFYTMTQLASSMSIAPPVALVRLVEGVRTSGNGTTTRWTSDAYSGYTTVQALLDVGQTVELTVDAGSSFDLAGLPMTYTWTVLYPEQKNVSIEHLGGTKYRITAVHDSRLPKMRIPVLLTVSNGVYESNPAVVSFYPRGPTSYCTYQDGSSPANELNVNLRPIFTSSAAGDLMVSAGQEATFTLQCSDPEGFSTRYYRYLNEPGALDGDVFRLQTSAGQAGKTVALHFICSDGTGAYNSLEQKIVIQ